MQRVLLGIALIIISCGSHAGSEEKPFECKLRGTLPSGTEYELRVHETKFERTKESQPDDGSMWGIDGGFPLYVIKDFALSVGGKRTDIPRKALWDICNVHTAGVIERDGKVVVTMAGGDAAGSFTAEFTVTGNRLCERVVRMGELPDEIWERTEYHFDQ